MNKLPSRDRSIVRVAPALAVLTLATACGGSDSNVASSTTPIIDTIESTTATANTTAEQPAPTATSAPAAPGTTTSTVTDGTPAIGTVSVTHDYGTFEIPLQPARVLALENRRDLETAVVLQLPLAAVGTYGGTTNVAAPFVPVDLTNTEIISISEINLEQIASIQPDLILARDIYLDEGQAELLAEIAPLLPIAGEGNWRDDLQQVASWLRRDDLLAEALATYDAAIADVSARHTDAIADSPIAIVEYYSNDQTFYAGGLDDFQLQANTLAELGGSLVPFLTDRSYFDEPFSIEVIDEIADAAAILLVSNSEEEIAALADHPLWQSLPAVQAGRVVITDTRTNQGSVFAATEAVRLFDELYTMID